MHQHDWVFIVTVPITEKEVINCLRGQRLVFKKLDPTSGQVRDAHIGCMVCEKTVEEAVLGPCPGEPKGYDDKGIPHW